MINSKCILLAAKGSASDLYFTVKTEGSEYWGLKTSWNEWIKKMWHKYTREYYSASREKEILPFATTWMNLEGITLSEISQTKKDKYCVISLICGIFLKKK